MKPCSSYLDKAMMALRYGFGLPKFFLKPLSLEECYAMVRRRVEEREANFLSQLRRAVYSNPKSPYARLLRWAGCEYGDAERMIRGEGLEKTLEKLEAAGVYIAIEEYKGKKPVERRGLSFGVRPEDFDNPHVVQTLQGTSSGTSGYPVSHKLDFDLFAERAAEEGVQFDALGLYGAPYVLWTSLSKHLLYAIKIGLPPMQWFLSQSSSRNRLASYYAIAVGRFLGYRTPWPKRVAPPEAHKVAAWLARNRRAGDRCMFYTSPSLGVRVSSAACARGLDISGTHFIVGSEPLTPARARAIRSAGCAVTATYSSSEMGGRVAVGCANSEGDDVHLFKGRLAVTQQPRKIGGTGITVPAFRVTSLLSKVPKILINMETGDYGKLETRRCGCKFDELGLTDHLSHIRSFEKLTSEGMTFFAADVARIMEEILPARFGGGPLDYQAIEEGQKDGLSRLSVIVSPKVGTINGEMLIRTVLEELQRSGGSSRTMARVWQEAGTVRVRREEPHPTKGGKVFSFQVESN
jgi:hypothetical protein